MTRRNQDKRKTDRPSLLDGLSAPAWDIYDYVTLLLLGVILVSYFAFYGVRSMYVNYLWGDFGWWHEIVDRFAQGETPYRQFSWPFPPLALYLYGWVARVFGASFLVLRLVAMVITLSIAFMVFLIARHCVPKRILPVTAIASVMMGIGISGCGGETLGIGMYTPSAPLGILLSLICLSAGIKYIIAPSKKWLYILGIGIAGAFLTKHDFWPPVLACALLVSLYQWWRSSSVVDFGRVVVHWILPALVVSIGGYLLLIIQAGLPALTASLGIGLVRAGLNRSSPTWQGILYGLFFSSAFVALGSAILWWSRVMSRKKALLLLIIACVATAILGSIRLGMTYWIGSRVASGDTSVAYTEIGRYFYGRASSTQQIILLTIKHATIMALRNPIPLFIIVISAASSLWAFWKYRESPMVKVGLLLAIWVVAARMRRLFDHTDVLSLLVEPLFFILAIQIACRHKNVDANRCHRLSLSMVIVFMVIGLSLGTFYELLPRIRHSYEQIMTKKGDIRIPADQAAEFRIVERLIKSSDPTGDRPLLYLPIPGSLNYIFDRENSTGLTRWPSSEAIREALKKHQPILVIDCSLWRPKFATELLSPLDYRRVERPPADCANPMFEVYIPPRKD